MLLVLGAGVASFTAMRFTSSSSTSGDRAEALADEGAVQESVQEVMRGFHEDVIAGDFDAAWEKLSRRKQAQIEREDGFQAWREAQATKTPYLDPSGASVELLELDRDTGEATVRVEGMTWSKPGAPCSTWSGITWAYYEDGEWRYDPGYSTTPARESRWKARAPELLGNACSEQ